VTEPYTYGLTVRFRDLDAMFHVNNAVYATYLEQARGEFFREVLGLEIDEIDAVLARLEIDFRAPIELGDEVVVELRIPEIGESSIRMAYEILADGRTAATAESVQVSIDRETGRSRPIPERWHERLDAWLGR
jgi:acyl-CoA thioester hydrolase